MSTNRLPRSDPLFVLEDEGLSLLVVRQGAELYRSYDPGVRGLLELVDWFPGGLEGATVIDRVVGACAARVFEYLRVREVLGLLGSLEAERILHAAAIAFSFRVTVVEVLGREHTGTCPFEELALAYPDPRKLIPVVRTRLAELRSRPDSAAPD